MEILSREKLEEYLDTKDLIGSDTRPDAASIEISRSAVKKFINLKLLSSTSEKESLPSKVVAKDDLPIY